MTTCGTKKTEVGDQMLLKKPAAEPRLPRDLPHAIDYWRKLILKTEMIRKATGRADSLPVWDAYRNFGPIFV
ncbi:MAG: hypothetical protein OHK0039_25680 [Bacteroidia bacterium]